MKENDRREGEEREMSGRERKVTGGSVREEGKRIEGHMTEGR